MEVPGDWVPSLALPGVAPEPLIAPRSGPPAPQNEEMIRGWRDDKRRVGPLASKVALVSDLRNSMEAPAWYEFPTALVCVFCVLKTFLSVMY